MLSSIVVTSFDVLSGRDKQAFGHEGNNYFRDLVQTHREAYQGSRRRADKNAITKTVIGLVHDRNGRFLKLNADHKWAEMNDEMVYEKVSHALRGAKSPTASSSSSSSSVRRTAASAASSGARGAPGRRSAPSKAALNQFGRVRGIQMAIFERLVQGGRDGAAGDMVNVVSDSSLCGDDEASHADAAWPLFPLPNRQPQRDLLEEEEDDDEDDSAHFADNNSNHCVIPDDIAYGSLSDDVLDPADFQLLSSESLAFGIPSIGV
jgi:hypothetical protein